MWIRWLRLATRLPEVLGDCNFLPRSDVIYEESRGIPGSDPCLSRLNRDPLLPGEELAQSGLGDLLEGRVSDASLLVQIAAPRLRRLGMPIPDRPSPEPYEHQLYARLEERLGAGSHSCYNSLIRRIVSYARGLEREGNRGASFLPPRSP